MIVHSYIFTVYVCISMTTALEKRVEDYTCTVPGSITLVSIASTCKSVKFSISEVGTEVGVYMYFLGLSDLVAVE